MIDSLTELEYMARVGLATEEDFFLAYRLLADLDRINIEAKQRRIRHERAQRQAANYARYVLNTIGTPVGDIPDSAVLSAFDNDPEAAAWRSGVECGLPNGDRNEVRQ